MLNNSNSINPSISETEDNLYYTNIIDTIFGKRVKEVKYNLNDENKEKINYAINTCTNIQKKIFELKIKNNLSDKEISEILGKSLEEIEILFTKTLIHLRNPKISKPLFDIYNPEK